MLLSAGYQACLDVFCNQGPLALQSMHPTFVLFGQTLAAARSAPLIASLVGLLATFWIAHQLLGFRAAVAAGVLLAISPTYLKFSRLALPEMVALAPALLAIGAASRYRQQGGFVWLLGASVLYALSLLIKPVAAPAAAPIAVLALARVDVRRRDLALAATLGLAVLAVGCLLVGLDSILDQAAFRWQSRLAEGRGIDWNWWKVTDELSHDQPGIFALALAGAFGLIAAAGSAGARRSGRADQPTSGNLQASEMVKSTTPATLTPTFVLLVIGSWLAASLLLLLFHTPLHDKHIVIVLPPVALLAGQAIASLLGAIPRPGGQWKSQSFRPTRPPAPSPVVTLLALAIYVLTLPALAQRDGVLVAGSEMIEPDPAQQWYAAASTALAATTPPGSFVVTDFPYLAFQANRLVPPQLVESSLTRIRAGSLTDDVAIAEASRFDPPGVLLWWDRLTRLPRFKRWVDERYQVVRVFAADGEAVTTLYLRRDADLARVRPVLAREAPIVSGASFGALTLVSWGLDGEQAAPGDRLSMSAVWEPEAPVGRDLAAVLMLRAPERIVWTSQRLPLLGNGDAQRTWAAGRRIVWSGQVKIPNKLAPGRYLLSLRVAESGNGDFLPVRPPADQTRLLTDDPKGLELAEIVVQEAGATPRR